MNESKLKEVIASVLAIDEITVNDDLSADTVETWDSVKHLKLVLAIEEEFNISFTEEQILEIMNYPLIKEVLKEHNIHL